MNKRHAAGIIAVAVCHALALFSSAQTVAAGPPAPTPPGAATTPGCCGQQMVLIGQAATDTVEGGKTASGTAVPEDLRTEVYGPELVARADLPPGTYTLVISGSENYFNAPDRRVFSIQAISGGRGPTEADPKGESGTQVDLATGVDLYKLAGAQGKEVTLKYVIKHPGGLLRIVFTAQTDNAKFSSIKILDAAGNKAAWLFAEDVAELLKLPDTPPNIAGPEIYRDATQPMDKRVADLVRRMTLKEKVMQMQNTAPAIPRLDVPAYNYWSEGLHGVARNGYATVFPQAIGMSATFDPALLQTVGDTVATEARAKWAAFQAQGGVDIYGGFYRGLTFWSPNINLFRDPRWGRGQETYGEDPILTGTMGVAFIQGMQGNDPKYFKVVATAKHFAVHSGPEADRHSFNATPPLRDLYDSYLPHFEMAVREGHVYSVMGAYNRLYGTPANESDLLLKSILRHDWGFQGYVVSDCDAITDIWSHHKVEINQASASAGAVLAGCDLECGSNYRALPFAVDTNLIGEGAIDVAVQRVLLSRFKLGLFDPPAMVRYSGITARENDTPGHAALALKVARESMVLLKNDGTLPLSRSVRKIAVVGPNAEGLLPLLGNYNGTPSAPVPVLQGLRDAYRGTIVVVRGCDNAPRENPPREIDWQLVPDVCLRPAPGSTETGLKAEHFTSDNLTGNPVTVRTEKVIDIKGLIEWIIDGVPTYSGSSRWSGEFVAPADGTYRLTVNGSTQYRFTVNGQLVTNQWGPVATPGASEPAPGQNAISVPMKAGQAIPLVLESHQNGGVLDLQLVWDRADLDLSAAAASRVKDADVIVFVGGIDGAMETEEGSLRGTFQGFANGDRTAIELPACQEKLLHALAATGKPVVMVNMTGSAVAMPWEAEHVNAILQAWYPGEKGGTAIAETLFGDNNPSGKLPVTFYRATADLPPFTDYAMKGHTYRFFTGTPLFPFGYGLSYTTFKYGTLKLDKTEAAAADTLAVRIDVTNAGGRDGDEVVQLYARPQNPAPGEALQRLVAFQRLSIPAGKTVTATLQVPIARLRNWDVDRKAYGIAPATWELRAGTSSADTGASATLTVKP